MPTIPPVRKPAPPKRAARNVRPSAAQVTDTPNPPTMPVPEPEPPVTPVTPKAAAKPRAGSLESRLGEAFASVSVIPTFVGDQYSSFIIASRSQKLAHDLAELAKVNPRVKKTLENFLDGGVYGGVMFSAAALLLPIMWSYGILPAPAFDPFSPFYPTVPTGVVPRSVRTSRSSAGSRAAASPGQESQPVRDSAPVPSPEGVVVIKPSMVPPMNPAAL